MILTVLILLPLLGALVTAFVPSAVARLVGLGFAAATLVAGAVVAVQYDAGDGMQLTETHTWIESLGVHYALGVDGLGLLTLDRGGIDGAVMGGAAAVGGISSTLRRVQNGFVRSYALSLLGGALLVVLALLAVNLG
jgi:NADH:ubiquinone oxidoreductase subunit 5 (subunit L)/multisubunit Na+/H+ antiporter MnhA subunit